MSAAMFAAVKELKAVVELLKARIEALEPKKAPEVIPPRQGQSQTLSLKKTA